MLTKKKIKIYKEFDGDIDSWARVGSKKQQEIIDDGDWALIDGFLQDILLVERGLAIKEFADDLNRRLIENCDNQETIDQLKKITNKN